MGSPVQCAGAIHSILKVSCSATVTRCTSSSFAAQEELREQLPQQLFGCGRDADPEDDGQRSAQTPVDADTFSTASEVRVTAHEALVEHLGKLFTLDGALIALNGFLPSTATFVRSWRDRLPCRDLESALAARR